MVKKILVNLAVFEVGWLVCVMGGDFFAVAFTLFALILHGYLVLGSQSEWKFIVCVVAVGCLWDVAMAKIGVINYTEVTPLGIPLWLICLWVLFATTFMHGLRWLNERYLLAGLLAAVLGPATYWAGGNLNDAHLGEPITASFVIMAAGWALLFPCGMYCAGKMSS